MLLQTHVFTLIAVSGLLTINLQSQASCEFKPGSAAVSSTHLLPEIAIAVPRDAIPGTALGSKIAVPDGPSTIIACDFDASHYYYLMLALGSPGAETNTPQVYPTNLPGIGVKIWSEFNGTYTLSHQADTPRKWYGIYSSTGLPVYVVRGIKNIYLQYYVTGPVTVGTATLDSDLTAWANSAISNVTSGLIYAQMKIKNTATFHFLSCETPNISVVLQKYDRQQFSSVGSTSPGTAFNFAINQCPMGLNSVNYTFRPAAGISLAGTGSGQHLTLSSNSTATGVGVQVLYDDETLVPFNTKIRFPNYVDTMGGSYTIPMKARYIRTGHITGGTVNSALEFEMSYE